MKFITEIDLRNLYKDRPFKSYKLGLETKLTPGARQFLIDKRIEISEDNFKKSVTNSVDSVEIEEKKLFFKVKSVEAIFLLTAEELLNIDVLLAQKIVQLSEQFTNVKNALKGKEHIKYIDCNDCTGINADNFSQILDDCFEISSFHIQLDRSKEIITLHRLRCALCELEPAILEYCNCREEDELYREVIKKVNQLINTLSQIICSLIGGKKCQRKS